LIQSWPLARLSSWRCHCRYSPERPNVRYRGLSSMRCSPRTLARVGDRLPRLLMQRHCTGGDRDIGAPPPVFDTVVGRLWCFFDFKVRSYCGGAISSSSTSSQAGSACVERGRRCAVHERELADGENAVNVVGVHFISALRRNGSRPTSNYARNHNTTFLVKD
jgi:hypothetical protein